MNAVSDTWKFVLKETDADLLWNSRFNIFSERYTVILVCIIFLSLKNRLMRLRCCLLSSHFNYWIIRQIFTKFDIDIPIISNSAGDASDINATQSRVLKLCVVMELRKICNHSQASLLYIVYAWSLVLSFQFDGLTSEL